MFVERSKNGWIVHAPAKINLALEVLGRRPDGYHQVETLLVPLRLFDTLVYSPTNQPLQFSVRGTPNGSWGPLASDAADNLVVRAVRRLAELSGRRPTGRLTLFKRIPLEAGLGGGSSDAAAALAVANRAWGLGYSSDRLAAIAAELGTDVPFFLSPGAALGTGRGEQIRRVPFPAGLPIVLVRPSVGLSTARVFAALGLSPGEQASTLSHRCQELAQLLKQGAAIPRWRHLVQNCLQGVAAKLCTEIERIADAMNRLPVLVHQMTGSGSSYFAVCRTWREARCVASRLRGQMWPFVTATQTGI